MQLVNNDFLNKVLHSNYVILHFVTTKVHMLARSFVVVTYMHDKTMTTITKMVISCVGTCG